MARFTLRLSRIRQFGTVLSLGMAHALGFGQTVFAKVVGKTDAEGKMSFTVGLPASLVGLPIEQGNALVTLRATVSDGAGQEVKKAAAVSGGLVPFTRLRRTPWGTPGTARWA